MSKLPFAFFLAVAVHASIAPGDSERGRQVFENQNCIQCHSIAGKGGAIGPDLSQRIDRNFTPVMLAATMWNHAPAMWAAMRKQGIRAATLSDESAADLFAYFFSVRFFERPGDAGRGKAAFTNRRCAECHGITETKFAGAKPVASWESLGHPIEIARAMWNHSETMGQGLAKKGIAWPQLTAQELTDILVYLRNLPQTRNRPSGFAYAPASGGDVVFKEKGCAGCHTGELALESRLVNATLTDIAVDMWNHASKMARPLTRTATATSPPQISDEEMRKLLSDIWLRQFLRGAGDPGRGKSVFTAKKCAECHSGAGPAPKLARAGGFSGVTMVSALWGHGPRMAESMRERQIAWPRFEAGQMADLIAYLNSLQ